MMAMGLGFAWLVAANVLALVPSRDNLWTRAYVLIAVGIPLLGYITYTNGPLLGMAFLIAGGSVLRWPVIYLARWVRRMMARTES
ncbi:MAG: DUF2484 family protein [Octadecabacter sp.]|nr:DUF2484 family protein [Octadecabacter sp.]